jgi:ABC-type multidrug transport system fused ATPase/permease subunit
MTSKAQPSFFNKVRGLLTPHERRKALLLLVLMSLGMALETLGVGLVIPAIAVLTQSDPASKYPALQPVLKALGNPDKQALVVGGMLLLVGVYFVKASFMAFLGWQQARFAFGVQANISHRLFSSYIRQPYTFHLQRNSAQLTRNVINEVNLLTFTCILPAMSMLTEVLVMLGLCVLLLVFEPVGAVIVLSVLGVAAGGFHYFTRRRITRWGDARQYHEGLRMQHLQQGLGGVKDVKLLGRETEFLELYRLHNAKSAQMGQLQTTLQLLPRLWLEFLAVCGLAILIMSVLAQGRPLEAVLPALGLFAAAAFRLMPSVTRVISAAQSLRYGLPVVNTLFEELQLDAQEEEQRSRSASTFHTALELDKVSYTYPGSTEPALRELSLVVQRGESVGFVGSSGAGKSTLVDVILGLLPASGGEVKVDGRNIQHALRDWQNQIGYVPQIIYLTDDTVMRNVAFGLPDEQIDKTAVWRAILTAQLEDFVLSLADGLEAVVGERGVRLSGGQRQRIGIARALYHDPAVLVLDEATSALDTETEFGVMQSVRALQGDKTIIIIAHRLSTVEHCNRLYRLEQGRLLPERALEPLPVQALVP